MFMKEITIHFLDGNKETYGEGVDEITMDSIGINIRVEGRVMVFPYNNIFAYEYTYEDDIKITANGDE